MNDTSAIIYGIVFFAVKSGEQLLVFNANRDEDDDGEDDVFIVRR